MNKKKIINDPVFGFITIDSQLVLQLINHPDLQRLRRIKQLGLTEYVYPSAVHTRFHHALGATHLMTQALDTLRSKGIKISDDEYESAQAAILLHDIGHGPLSHTLESTLMNKVDHELVSLLIMKKLNKEFDGKLDLAIQIFSGDYERNFFHQLVSGHIDMDRMDYLKRDSFYTGVSEGNIGISRIIKMLNVVDDNLVVEEKGLFNIENFLMARRFMYWQVYLHKTTVAAEKMISNLFARGRELMQNGNHIPVSDNLRPFLETDISIDQFHDNADLLNTFISIDDSDVWSTIKGWAAADDKILSQLSQWILDRKLFQTNVSIEPYKKDYLDEVIQKIAVQFNLDNESAKYFYSEGIVYNSTYSRHGSISILTKDGPVLLENISDIPSISEMGKILKKYYLCYPKNVSL